MSSDRAMVEGDEAAIEWYVSRDGRIAEVRAYYRWLPGKPVSQLIGFPYAERGYPDGPGEPTHEDA